MWPALALSQKAWERRQAALRAREHATLAEIGRALGLSPQRIQQLTERARNRPRFPIEKYLSSTVLDDVSGHRERTESFSESRANTARKMLSALSSIAEVQPSGSGSRQGS